MRDLGANLVLATGDGYVRMLNREVTRYGRMVYDLPGVQVGLSIPFTR